MCVSGGEVSISGGEVSTPVPSFGKFSIENGFIFGY